MVIQRVLFEKRSVCLYLSLTALYGEIVAKKKKKKKNKKKSPKTQTEPPTVPVSKLFSNGVFPEGETHEYRDEYVFIKIF